MSRNSKPKSRREDIVVQEIDGEVLIYDLKSDKAFCLNQTSALVWQACDGTKTIAEINDVVGKQLNANVNEDLVWLALDQLSREKLIDEKIPAPAKFDGLSRRAAIKKAGLGAMIALPVVASLVAPMVAHANSLCMVGGNCNCDSLPDMGTICSTSGAGGVPCLDTNCQCQRQNAGNSMGTCVP